MEWQNWEFLQSPFPISLPFPSLQLLLDASSQGWGGDFISRQGLRDLAFGVPGLVHEPARLMTIFHSLEHFRSTLQGNPVLVMSENSTAVACFRNQGIQRSVSLLNLSSRVWLWFRQTAMSTSVSSGIQNISFSFRSLCLTRDSSPIILQREGNYFCSFLSCIYYVVPRGMPVFLLQ